jgi:hypothetical protein
MTTNLDQLSGGRFLLDPYHGDSDETCRPDAAWPALTALAIHRRKTPT